VRLSPLATWVLLGAVWVLAGLLVALAVGRIAPSEPPRAARSRLRGSPRPSVHPRRLRGSERGYRPSATPSRGVVVPLRPRLPGGGEGA